MANESNRYGDVLAELDAITAPAEAAPVVASFVLTPAAAEMLTASELEAALADLPPFTAAEIAEADFLGLEPIRPDPARLAAVEAKEAELVADAKANGWTARAYDSIDAHRQTPKGRSDRNWTRKLDRANRRMEETGELPRAYKSLADLTPDEREARRKEQKAASKAKLAAARTPDEIAAERTKESADRAARRQRERDRLKAEREAQAIF